jgi:hypothetical protein
MDGISLEKPWYFGAWLDQPVQSAECQSGQSQPDEYLNDECLQDEYLQDCLDDEENQRYWDWLAKKNNRNHKKKKSKKKGRHFKDQATKKSPWYQEYYLLDKPHKSGCPPLQSSEVDPVNLCEQTQFTSGAVRLETEAGVETEVGVETEAGDKTEAGVETETRTEAGVVIKLEAMAKVEDETVVKDEAGSLTAGQNGEDSLVLGCADQETIVCNCQKFLELFPHQAEKSEPVGEPSLELEDLKKSQETMEAETGGDALLKDLLRHQKGDRPLISITFKLKMCQEPCILNKEELEQNFSAYDILSVAAYLLKHGENMVNPSAVNEEEKMVTKPQKFLRVKAEKKSAPKAVDAKLTKAGTQAKTKLVPKVAAKLVPRAKAAAKVVTKLVPRAKVATKVVTKPKTKVAKLVPKVREKKRPLGRGGK